MCVCVCGCGVGGSTTKRLSFCLMTGAEGYVIRGADGRGGKRGR